MFALNSPPPMANSLRVLSALLTYPDARMRGYLPEMSELLHDEGALSPARQADVDALMDTLRQADPLQAESDYVDLFDRGRATSLHLFEHVHGDSRERGPALIDLGQTYENAGLILAEGELPDFLPALLEFVSTQPPGEAKSILGEMAHILNAIFGALQQRGSAYASVLGALLDLAGEQATASKPFQPLAEEPLDASWAEPVVFDGCSAKGQSRPGQAQAIHVMPFKPVRAPGAQANPPSGVVA